MKKVMAFMLCAGLFAGSYGTASRILSMGKHDAFFMDEVSVFRNPANTSIYPNMLMGSYGVYEFISEDTIGTQGYGALSRGNRDPKDPYFGAILTYSLRKSTEEGSQYPMISFGGVFNRADPLLKYFDVEKYALSPDTVVLRDPVGKVDLMFGYAFPNGGMIGLGTYLAFQNEDDGTYKSNLFKGTVGMNWPVARSMDFEASIGVAAITAIGQDTVSEKSVVLADNDITIEADLRLFSALTALNGDFVPRANVIYSQLEQGKNTTLSVAGGLGLNINIDKGFFWAGLDGLYDRKESRGGGDSEAIGGRVSFGIERNVVWDWFVVRVGGMKTIMYRTEGKNKGKWIENDPSDGSEDDLVGLGIGLNVENRLKFDILVAEDIVYTLTNLFSGPQHHIFTRIDATFSF